MKHKKISRQEIIYQIALAGICAGLALFLVWLSVLLRYGTIALYVAAGIVIMIPLTQRYYLSSVFAYVVSAVLGFVIAGDIIAIVGYVAYFGPMALITGIFCNKKVKWWISLIVKVAYINGVLALLYFVCHTIVIDKSVIEEVPYWLVVIVGTIGLVAIDFVEQLAYDKVAKIVGRVLRKKDDDVVQQVVGDDEMDNVCGNPFDEFDD